MTLVSSHSIDLRISHDAIVLIKDTGVGRKEDDAPTKLDPPKIEDAEPGHTKTFHPRVEQVGFSQPTELAEEATRRVDSLKYVPSEAPTPIAPPDLMEDSSPVLDKMRAQRKEGADQTGEPFGRYMVLGRLGKGGMADVRLASFVDGGQRRHCVIKRILASKSDERRLREMFAEEGRICEKLEHPNVVELLESGDIDGVPYLAFELIDGVTIREVEKLLESRKLPFRAIVEIGAQAALALSHAHTATDANGVPLNVVHRDVTPQNILIDRAGNVKLADFGIARFEGREHETAHGLVKGKLGFLSPEQIAGGAIDGRSDVFSLGLVLAGLLVGRRVLPPQVLVLAESASLIQRCVNEASYDVPKRFESLLTKMVSIDPADRPDASQVAASLEGLLSRLDAEATWNSAVEREAGLVGETPLAAREREGLRSFMERVVFSRLPAIDPAQVGKIGRDEREDPDDGTYAKTLRAVRPLTGPGPIAEPRRDITTPIDFDEPDATRLNATRRLKPGEQLDASENRTDRTPIVSLGAVHPSSELQQDDREPNYWLIAAFMIVGAIAIAAATLFG